MAIRAARNSIRECVRERRRSAIADLKALGGCEGRAPEVDVGTRGGGCPDKYHGVIEGDGAEGGRLGLRRSICARGRKDPCLGVCGHTEVDVGLLGLQCRMVGLGREVVHLARNLG